MLRRDARQLHDRHRDADPVGRLLELPGFHHFTIYGELTRPDGAPGGRGGFGGTPTALSAREALEMAPRHGAVLLGRDDVGDLAPGMSADLIAIKLDQLGLSGTQRDPLAAMVMCGPFRVDHSFIDGRQVVERGALVGLDVDALLAEHAEAMARVYPS